MQRWAAYLQNSMSRQWSEGREQRTRIELLTLELYVARRRIAELEAAIRAVESAKDAVRL